MNDSFDEIIDFLLKSIKENNGIDKMFLLSEIEKTFFKTGETKKSLKYFEFMREEGLVTLDNDNKFRISRKGLIIIENGGWLNELKKQQQELDFNNEKTLIEFKNTEFSLQLNEWLLKTKWLPTYSFYNYIHIFSLCLF